MSEGANGTIRGGKALFSGAGHALVSATRGDGGAQSAQLPTDEAVASPLGNRMQGMRAAGTGRTSFEGMPAGPDAWIRVPGNYLREPWFSAGAWHTSAVTCGGLESLVGLAMRRRVVRGRGTSPHQPAPAGPHGPGGDTAEIVATVNFACIAIEAACLEAMALVARSLGLTAFMHPNPVERVSRDLDTCLRQQAAAHIMQTRMQPE